MTSKKKPTLDEIIDNFQSECCGAFLSRTGKTEYRCTKCNTDVTLELFYKLNAFT